MQENRPPEDYRMIDMGDGTYGISRGDKLVHKGLPSETAALRLAATYKALEARRRRP